MGGARTFDPDPGPLPAGVQTGGRGGRPEDEADSGEPHQPGGQVGDPLLGEVSLLRLDSGRVILKVLFQGHQDGEDNDN